MANARGIDVSVWQRTLPKDAGQFVFVRGVYGEGVDTRVDQHVKAARERGLHVGLYAFGVRYYGHNLSSAQDQSDVLLRLADRLNIDRVALDWESDGVRPMMRESTAREYIERVKARHGECGLYASEWQFKNLGQTWDWVAKWGTTPPNWNYEFWQYQGTPIDRNYFNGDAGELSAWFHRASGAPAPKPDPYPVDPEPPGGDVLFNVAPITTHRDVVLKAGTVLYSDSGLKRRHSRVEDETPLGFVGSTRSAHVVVNSGNTNYIRRSDAARIEDNERDFE